MGTFLYASEGADRSIAPMPSHRLLQRGRILVARREWIGDQVLALVFDGDDTLWETESLYDIARSEAAAIVASDGYDAAAFEQLQKSIDAHNVKTMGLARTRFPMSSEQAYRELAKLAGRPPNSTVMKRVSAASASVFERRANLMPGAREALKLLKPIARLALLTKGDVEVQRRRIADSGLAPYFDHISIVATKDAASFVDVLAALDAVPGGAWSIGNSVPSDIAPALELGMQAIWIDAHVWVHERHQLDAPLLNERVHVAEHLTEAAEIIAAVEHIRVR